MTDFHDKERNLDWLTACVPVLVLAFIYFRWSVLWLALPAVAGYSAAAYGLQRLGLTSCRILPAVVAGLWLVFCLPASAPVWVGAVAGAVAAGVAAVPTLLSRYWEGKPFARPLLQPVLVGQALVWLVFSGLMGPFPMPAQWQTVDGVTGATALAGLFDPALSVERWRLFFGIYPGALGEVCSAVLLLAMGYLLLRRRVRLLPPACMLATVSLLSWLEWGSPLYGLLAGGTLLSAILLGDATVAPAHYGTQVATGVVAGILTVVLRATPHTDGSAVGALVGCALAPVLELVGGLLCRLWRWFLPYATRFFAFIQTKFQKNENKG